MPIELGDIFEVKQKDVIRNFVLLAQPCDLMVRKNGKRKKAVQEAILAEIINPDKLEAKDDKGKPKDIDAFYELCYFNKNSKESFFVSFQKRHSIKLSIIDLCAYQNDGSARLNIDSPCHEHVIPTWQSHYKNLVGIMAEYINQYKKIYSYCIKLPREEHEQILALAVPRILALPPSQPVNEEESPFTGKFIVSESESSIYYDLRRCGRLSQAHSTALLAKFAAFIARTAFEHDFGE
jgi:hypothetical protein